jgi:hypothetical protein
MVSDQVECFDIVVQLTELLQYAIDLSQTIRFEAALTIDDISKVAQNIDVTMNKQETRKRKMNM